MGALGPAGRGSLDIIEWFYANRDTAVVVAVISAIAGAILGKFIPFMARKAGAIRSWLVQKFLGRHAVRDFEKRYLDWLVMDLRELRLAGIVTTDDAKKPKLEQVFVSLRVSEDLNQTATETDIESLLDLPNPAVSPTLLRRIHEVVQAHTFAMGAFPSDESPSIRVINRSYGTFLSEAKRRGKPRQPESAALLEFTVANARQRIWVEASKHGRVTFRLVGAPDGPAATAPDTSEVLNVRDRVAILGAPGAGKTTLLQHIGLCYGRKRAGDPAIRRELDVRGCIPTKPWRTPIFVPLTAVAAELVKRRGKTKHLLECIHGLLPVDLQTHPASREYFQRKVRAGQAILLLDGLDEVPNDKDFRSVTRAIESFAATYSGNKLVVTSRIAGWRGGLKGDFAKYYVDELTLEQIDVFVDSWYSAVERNSITGSVEDETRSEQKSRERRVVQRASDLKRAIRENDGIRRLASNPMLLSIIALVHRSLVTLPKERSKLYKECSKILLEQWDMSKGLRVDDTNLKLEQKEALMRGVAFAFHTGEIGDRRGGRLATREEVESVVAGLLPDMGRLSDEAPQLIQRLVERSGLLVEKQRGMLSFGHLTFQEHFAAQFLAGKGEEGLRFLLEGSRLSSDWWREVILLYSGALADATGIIDGIWKGGRDDDLCLQRLRLAALCTAEATAISRLDLRKSLGLALLEVRGKRVPDPLTLESAELLENLLRWARTDEWFKAAAISSTKKLRDQPDRLAGLFEAALGSPQMQVRLAALDVLGSAPMSVLTEKVRSRVGEALSNAKDPREIQSVFHVMPTFLRVGMEIGTWDALRLALYDNRIRIPADVLGSAISRSDAPPASEVIELSQLLLQSDSFLQRRNGAVMLVVCALKGNGRALESLPPMHYEHGSLADEDLGHLLKHAEAQPASLQLEFFRSASKSKDEIVRRVGQGVFLLLARAAADKKVVVDALSEIDYDLVWKSKSAAELIQVVRTSSLDEIDDWVSSALSSPDASRRTRALEVLRLIPERVTETRSLSVVSALSARRTDYEAAIAITPQIVSPEARRRAAELLIQQCKRGNTLLRVSAAQALSGLLDAMTDTQIEDVVERLLSSWHPMLRIAGTDLLTKWPRWQESQRMVRAIVATAVRRQSRLMLLPNRRRWNDFFWETGQQTALEDQLLALIASLPAKHHQTARSAARRILGRKRADVGSRVRAAWLLSNLKSNRNDTADILAKQFEERIDSLPGCVIAASMAVSSPLAFSLIEYANEYFEGELRDDALRFRVLPSIGLDWLPANVLDHEMYPGVADHQPWYDLALLFKRTSGDGEFKPDALDAVDDALSHPERIVRLAALEVLGKAAHGVPDRLHKSVIKRLGDEDLRVRDAALSILTT